MGYVYILKSLRNNTFYIGSTDNLERRIQEHTDGKSPYTSNLLPVALMFYQTYESLSTAIKAEQWLKKQKDKALLEKIIKEGKITRAFR